MRRRNWRIVGITSRRASLAQYCEKTLRRGKSRWRRKLVSSYTGRTCHATIHQLPDTARCVSVTLYDPGVEFDCRAVYGQLKLRQYIERIENRKNVFREREKKERETRNPPTQMTWLNRSPPPPTPNFY